MAAPSRRLVIAILAIAVLLFVVAAWNPLVAGDHDHATVTIEDEHGTELATFDAEVADTPYQRYLGLSDHDDLADDEGMLFVFEDEDDRAFVMRDMDFPIDIIFADANGEITTIYEAPVPEHDDAELERYEGSAQWVLEVPKGVAADRGIEPGDRLRIEFE